MGFEVKTIKKNISQHLQTESINKLKKIGHFSTEHHHWNQGEIFVANIFFNNFGKFWNNSTKFGQILDVSKLDIRALAYITLQNGSKLWIFVTYFGNICMQTDGIGNNSIPILFTLYCIDREWRANSSIVQQHKRANLPPQLDDQSKKSFRLQRGRLFPLDTLTMGSVPWNQWGHQTPIIPYTALAMFVLHFSRSTHCLHTIHTQSHVAPYGVVVCLSICLSQVGVLLKLLNVASSNNATNSSFLTPKMYAKLGQKWNRKSCSIEQLCCGWRWVASLTLWKGHGHVMWPANEAASC